MLKELKKMLSNNEIINANICEDKEIYDLLDLRDEKVFDEEWVRVFNILEEKSGTISYKEIIDAIRHEAFLKAYDVSSSSDFASCVSDDFELIAKAFVINYNDAWLNSLIETYATKKFPCGKLENASKTISEAFRQLLNNHQRF